jgi:hypothetical protein
MLNISKQYRSNYTGEDIITERKHENRMWSETVESVPNAVTNNQISNRAVILGNSPTRLDFDLNNLKHASGLLGANTLQTYGCNALYRDFTPDFLVAQGNDIVTEIAGSSYPQNNIVYTNAIDLLAYPNTFYLIPYNPYADSGTTAAYIAAFDGHKKIYLLGFHGQDTDNINFNIYAGTNGYDPDECDIGSDKWTNNLYQLFKVYNDVEFKWVTSRGQNPLPESWKYCPNLRQLSFRDFVTDADL